MLVKELIEKLKEMPQDALIVVPGDGDFAVAEWVELEKKESADRKSNFSGIDNLIITN